MNAEEITTDGISYMVGPKATAVALSAHQIIVTPSINGQVMVQCKCGWREEMGFSPSISELVRKEEEHFENH